jgi:hypothetical protein
MSPTMRVLSLPTLPTDQVPTPPEQDSEAREVLRAQARGHTGKISADLVVTHLLKVTAGGDFSLRSSAMDAVLRRIQSTQEEAGGWTQKGARQRGTLGLRQVVTSRRTTYRVQVRNFAGLEGSCECADFARNSLGLCKHLWWVLEQGFDSRGRSPEGVLPPPTLMWNPIRPLVGAAHWLERVSWTKPAMDPSLKRWFICAGEDWRIRPELAKTDDRRMELVTSLLEWAEAPGILADRADLAMLRLLQRERELLQAPRTPALKEAKVTSALRELKRKLFHYQEEGVRRFLQRGRLLLADDMGLGKTAQAIASCHVLFRTQQVRRGIIIVPAALKPQWLREWSLFTSVPATVVDGNPSERQRQYRTLRVGSSSSTMSRCSKTSLNCSVCGRTWWCSMKPSASRTGQPRRPSS